MNRIINEPFFKERKEIIIPAYTRPTLQESFRKVRGVLWWQLSLETGDITQVTFNSVTAGYKAGVQERIDVKKLTLYAPAINKKNAEKKFIKQIKDLKTQSNIIQWMDNAN